MTRPEMIEAIIKEQEQIVVLHERTCHRLVQLVEKQAAAVEELDRAEIAHCQAKVDLLRTKIESIREYES